MSVSGQWYPQGSTPPPQWSPPGTPGGTATNFPPTVATSPWGGYLPGNLTPEQQLAQQQQMQVQMQMQQQQAQAAGGQPNNLPPGMPPGMQGMPPGMPGMPPGYPMQQDCCASCCGPQGSAGCCGPTGASCCGPTGAGCCGPTGGGCCGPQQGQCCQCQMPGEPPDPYLCSPPVPGQTSCYECIYNSFDYTFLMMIICAALSVVGFGVVLGTKGMDDLFTTFGSVTTTELDEALIPHIIWRNADLDHPNITNTTTSTTSSSNKAPRATSSSHSQDSSESTSKDSSSSSEHHSSSSSSHEEVPRACTLRKLAGSFGGICMEDNLNANMFVVQLSHWNNARDTLWFLAMVYSVLSLLFAFLIHIQRNPSSQTGFPALTPEKQQEFMAMTPAQQQAFMQQLQLEQGQAAQQQSQGCCGRKGVEVYDTPYYEFFRFAWLFVGFTIFVWTCNLFVSFWAFSSFYVNHTTGPLQKFWQQYATKFTASVIVVTIYLAWPVCCFFVELIAWIIGMLPWVLVRTCCKQGIGNYRPALPNSQLPCCIRSDMFFMDFNDLKRLGFSRQAWIILTGSDKPFIEACSDPAVDRDPNMTNLLASRAQWQQMHPAGMMGFPGMMMGPGGMYPGMPGMPPGLMPGMMTPPQQGSLPPSGVNTPQRAGAPEAEAPEGEEKKRRRHRSRSRSGSRSRSKAHRSAGSHVDPGLEQTSGAEGLAGSRRKHHSSRSRSPGEGGSRSRRHRSEAKSDPLAIPNDPLALPPMPPPVVPFAIPAAPAPAVPSEGKEGKRRHRSSRSREKSSAAAAGGERRHRSREKSAGEGEQRRHRSSKSRDKAAGGESRHRSSSRKEKKENKDLDALMEL